MYHTPPVDDALLRKLSLATQLIGKRIRLKTGLPEQETIIINAIILPCSEFYTHKFMGYYIQYGFNAVKSLKELVKNFSFTPDYQLDIGYVLDLPSSDYGIPNKILQRSDFILLDELSINRLGIYTGEGEKMQPEQDKGLRMNDKRPKSGTKE